MGRTRSLLQGMATKKYSIFRFCCELITDLSVSVYAYERTAVLAVVFQLEEVIVAAGL